MDIFAIRVNRVLLIFIFSHSDIEDFAAAAKHAAIRLYRQLHANAGYVMESNLPNNGRRRLLHLGWAWAV